MDGKNVRFQYDDGYGKFTCDDVTFRVVTRKDLKEVFPEGARILLKYVGRHEGNDIWKCIGLE